MKRLTNIRVGSSHVQLANGQKSIDEKLGGIHLRGPKSQNNFTEEDNQQHLLMAHLSKYNSNQLIYMCRSMKFATAHVGSGSTDSYVKVARLFTVEFM